MVSGILTIPFSATPNAAAIFHGVKTTPHHQDAASQTRRSLNFKRATDWGAPTSLYAEMLPTYGISKGAVERAQLEFREFRRRPRFIRATRRLSMPYITCASRLPPTHMPSDAVAPVCPWVHSFPCLRRWRRLGVDVCRRGVFRHRQFYDV